MKLSVLEVNPANDIARQMTGRDYLSYSQVSTFCTCPLRWYFHYVLALPQEQVGASLVFGGAIHKAIEFYYDAQMIGDDPPDVDRLVEVFDQACKREQSAPIRFGKGETWDTLHEMARRMIDWKSKPDLPANVHATNALCNLQDGEYQIAESELLTAFESLPNTPGARPHRRFVAQAILKLYETWNTVQPGQGFDQKATNWRSKCADLEPTTQPFAPGTTSP
jgi:hypothetical protein